MTEQLAKNLHNPLFLRYGKIVERFVLPDVAVGTPISIFPIMVEGVHKIHGSNSFMGKQLDDCVPPTDLQFIQKSVDELRASLAEETTRQTEKGHSGIHHPLTEKLQEFRHALHTQNEAMMVGNPLYELTGLIFRTNIAALKAAFVSTQGEVAAINPPRPIQVTQRFLQIWKTKNAIVSLRQKLFESFSKMGFAGKIILGFILFIGSLLTTAKGAVDLMQLPSFVRLTGVDLSGSAYDTFRIVLALFCGLTLSAIILDFKMRLFRGVAEAGRVFQGFWLAFKHNPRWFFIAILLTMVSIRANYDGIVFLLAKTADVSSQAAQWETIQAHVANVLGDPQRPQADRPESLSDLKAALTHKVAEAIQQFQQIPDGEIPSSPAKGAAVKSPRYWGKHVIVHGGYTPKQKETKRANKNTEIADKVDQVLRNTKLDLTKPFADKANHIINLYAQNLDRTQADIKMELALLKENMRMRSFSWHEMSSIFNHRTYPTSATVRKVTDQIEESRRKFQAAVQEINQLTTDTISLLRDVDKIGEAANTIDNIEVLIPVPPLARIDPLPQKTLPIERPTLAELRLDLTQRYGPTLGSAILLAILFAAISMDLSDPLFFSAMFARWGRRDQHFLKENIAVFRQWEAQYVQGIRAFFFRPNIRPLLPNLPLPDTHVIHHTFHRVLEDINPAIKDPLHWSTMERLRFWFSSLLRTARIHHVEAYNARLTVALRSIRDHEFFAHKLLNLLFPGILDDFRINIDLFDDRFKTINQAVMANGNHLDNLISTLVTSCPLPDLQSGPNSAVAYASYQQRRNHSQLVDSCKNWLRMVFLQPIEATNWRFPLSRLNWLEELASSSVKLDQDINSLANHTPFLLEILTQKLPHIRGGVLNTLTQTLAHIPNWSALDQALRIRSAWNALDEMDQTLKTLLGLSSFHNIQVNAEWVEAIVGSSKIDEIIRFVTDPDYDGRMIVQKIEQIEGQLLRANTIATHLVEEQNELVFTLTKIRRDYVSAINDHMSHLQNRDIIENTLKINELNRELFVVEAFLYELWDETLVEAALPLGAAQLGRTVTGANSAATLIANQEKQAGFDLLEMVKKLEEKAKKTHETIQSNLFVLTFIDKIYDKVDAQLNDIRHVAVAIFNKDTICQHDSVDKQQMDPKKISFLENNRLFFRSMPLQIEVIRQQKEAWMRNPDICQAGHVESFRTLESQTIKLQTFLKHALDYLDGKRGALLPVELTQLNAPIITHRADPIMVAENKNGLLANPLSATIVTKIKQTCADIKQILFDISMKEWDLLKNPIPPQESLQKLRSQQPVIDNAHVTVEKLLSGLEELLKRGQQSGIQAEEMAALQFLFADAKKLLTTLDQIALQLSTPIAVDRRAQKTKTTLPETAQEKPVLATDHDDTRSTQSRRAQERTRVQSRIELSVAGEKFVGTTHDMSTRSLCFTTDLPHNLQPTMTGTFRLLSDPQKMQFSCHIVRISGPMVILALTPGNEAHFASLIRKDILQNKTVGVDPEH